MPRTEQELAAIAERAEQWLDTVDPAELTPVAPQLLRLREAVAAREAAEAEIGPPSGQPETRALVGPALPWCWA